jgi:integrase
MYWYTTAGGQPVYFGNVKEVSHEDARREFTNYLKSLSDGQHRRNGFTCLQLMEHFLEWVKLHRSDCSFDQKQRDCQRFANFKVDGHKVADLPAMKITGDDLEAWLMQCKRKDKSSPRTLMHRQTSIKHCWNWGTKHPSPTPHLPTTFRPFSGVEPIQIPHKVLTEDDLIMQEEVQTLFAAARIDLDSFHAFGPKTPREHNPYEDFEEMLQAYYHTGARTSELSNVLVGDVLTRTKQVVLGQHKTSKTQRSPKVRRITLNDDAMGILERHCAGKSKKDHVFTTSDGKPWKRRALAGRFNRIKEVAEEMELGEIRENITIYDFRHLWISDALMAGNDIATVARMAGTSIAMIEGVYGHFRNEHLQQAQARLDEMREQRQN